MLEQGNGWRRVARAIAGVLVLAAVALPGSLQAQAAPPPALEILGVQHDPAGTLSVALRAGSRRDSEIRSLTMFVDDVPVVMELGERSEADDLALVLAIDTSGSMEGEPIGAAREAARALITRLPPDDPLGLVSFATWPFIQASPTSDHDLVLSIVDSLQAEGWTALYDAVALGAGALGDAPEGRRVVVLLSDGQDFGGVSNVGREGSLDAARRSGVVVYAVGLGPSYDEEYLTALADATGGQFFPMRDETDAVALTALFAQLGGQLGASDTYTVPMRPLAEGAHELSVRAVVNGVPAASATTFGVTNSGLLALAVEAPGSAGDPIELRLNPLVDAGTISFEAHVGDVTFRPDSSSSTTIPVDPWRLAPGAHEVEVVAFAGGGIARREVVSVDIPTLEPVLTVSPGQGGIVARSRVQQASPALLVAYSDGAEVARSRTGTLVLKPESGATTIQMLDADGRIVATHDVPAPLAPAAAEGALPLPLVLAVLAAGAGVAWWWRAKRRPRRRPVAERILRPLPRKLPDGEVASGPTARSVQGLVEVIDRQGNRRTVPLTSRPLTVGSSLACDIVLGDASVRAQHLRITVMSPTEVRVHALGDRGSRPYDGYEEDEWLVARDGEQIVIGSHHLQIVMNAGDPRLLARAEAGA